MTRINLRISPDFGAESETRTICVGYKRANSKQKFGAEELEKWLECQLEHETIHIVLSYLFEDKEFGDVVSWLMDYIDYRPRNIIEKHEIPPKEILLKPVKNLQNLHKEMLRKYLRKYYGKVMK